MASELVPTEVVVNALLEHLVAPRLPLKSSVFKEALTLSQQQSVAKQLHAVVLLYNYYHRKQNPEAEYLDFESFCKLVVTLKPALMSYMKFTNQSDSTASKDMDNDLSVTEEAIQDACNISCTLDASKDVPSINKWLITKVSVLLLDSKRDTCWLLYGSISDGVWSLVEKCLELPTAEIEGTVERKHLNKKRRSSMRPVTVEKKDDDSGFQQLAFLAVKDATGISRSDLVVLEKHVVYSLTKEKTASCFYIMQCTQSINQDFPVPVKDILESLQGPLVKRSSGSWSAADVVEYFHLLPYASIMSTFFLREVSTLEGSNTRSHEDITENCEKEISESSISLFDQNMGNVSIRTAIGPESTCSNVVNDMYDRNVNPTEAFSAEVFANNGCERNTEDQKDIGEENGGHHHHETVTACGSFSGKAKEESASEGSESVEEKIEKMEEKIPDESYEALIGTKSDHINLEISEEKKGDVCHEKVSHSAVGQEANVVDGPHRIRRSGEAGRDSSINNKNTEIIDLSGDKLTGVNLKCSNDTSNKVRHEDSRDNEESTVKELHAVINHSRTSKKKTEEPVKSTTSCEFNDYNDRELVDAHLEHLEVKINDGYHFSSSPTSPQRMSIDACIPCTKDENNSKDCKLIKENYHHQKKRMRESGAEIIGSGIICKAQRTDEGKTDKERDLSTISPNQNGISVAHTGPVPDKHDSKDIGDLLTVLASKKEALIQRSLEILRHKRQKLCHQNKKIGDEIALCDKSIRRILDGGKDGLALMLDTLVDFGGICLKDRAATQEDGHQPHEELGLI